MHVFAPASRQRGHLVTPTRSERGVNVLLLTVLGIVATIIFLGVGIAPMLGAVDSTDTAKAKTMLEADIPAVVHQYQLDNFGQLPDTNNTWMDVKTAMPGYFPVTPCDPVDNSCTPTSSASDFTIISGPAAYGSTSDYTIAESAAISHPIAELNGLPGWNGQYGFPTGTCTATSCTHGRLFFRAAYGRVVGF